MVLMELIKENEYVMDLFKLYTNVLEIPKKWYYLGKFFKMGTLCFRIFFGSNIKNAAGLIILAIILFENKV